jgi:superfamily II DNA helicase RecQ
LQTKITELQEQGKAGNDKKLNDALKLIEEKDKSIGSYKELAETNASKLEAATNEFQTGMKTYKINHQFEQYKNKLNWIDEPTGVQRIGFDTVVESKYRFDLDEKENLIVLDKEGKPIPSKLNGGKMADPLEILDAELEANKLKKLNNANNKNNGIFTPQNREKSDSGREFTSDYQRRLSELKK